MAVDGLRSAFNDLRFKPLYVDLNDVYGTFGVMGRKIGIQTVDLNCFRGSLAINIGGDKAVATGVAGIFG